MKLDNRFDNFPQSDNYTPCNQPIELCCKCEYDSIINRGTTASHLFILPDKYRETIKECIITYKQGLSIILTKTLNDEGVEYLNSKDKSLLKVTLSVDETLLFKSSYSMSPVEVQLKLFNNDNKVFVTNIFLFKVYDSLDLTINGEM
nr:MAG TPA: hypothetical protein [Caudoviricetes sp.]